MATGSMFDNLEAMLVLLAAVSLAAERLVEIIKEFLLTRLTEVKTDPKQEARRQGYIHLLTLFACLLTASLLKFLGQLDFNWLSTLVIGFLATGGSSLWNSLLGWVKGLKDIRQSQGEATRLAVQSGRLAPLTARPDGRLPLTEPGT